MKTSKRSVGQDRKRVSAQSHEIGYAAKKLKSAGSRKKATAAVLKAKKGLGRKTSRKAVMRRAKAIAGK